MVAAILKPLWCLKPFKVDGIKNPFRLTVMKYFLC